MTDEIVEIEICVDCLFAWANGDLPEDTDDAERVSKQEGISEGWIVAPGHLHTLELCGPDVMDGGADCPYDEGSFSWSSCQACHSPLGGDRFPACTFPIHPRPEWLDR